MSAYAPVVLWCVFVSQQLQVDGLRSSLHTPVLKRQQEHNQLPNLERVFTCLKLQTATPQQFAGKYCMFSCTALVLRAKRISYFPDKICMKTYMSLINVMLWGQTSGSRPLWWTLITKQLQPLVSIQMWVVQQFHQRAISPLTFSGGDMFKAQRGQLIIHFTKSTG